jgi:methylated-DNA-[protein]-cysteine S-methyltransferase
MSKNSIFIQTYKSPVGDMILGSYDNALCIANWKYAKTKERIERKLAKALNAEYIDASSEVIEEAKKQLDEYFAGKRSDFDLPLLMVGTDFQKSVWHALLEIPYGETASYLEQAKRIGNEKAVRAVASANGVNAISIFIPCHRIIGSNGTLTGYAGGLDTKAKLLELERLHLMKTLKSSL